MTPNMEIAIRRARPMRERRWTDPRAAKNFERIRGLPVVQAHGSTLLGLRNRGLVQPKFIAHIGKVYVLTEKGQEMQDNLMGEIV